MCSTLHALEHLIEAALTGWGRVVTAVVVSAVATRYDMLMPVVRTLKCDAPPASQRVIARFAELGLWLLVPLTLAMQADFETLAAGSVPAVFVAVLIRQPLKDYLSGFVTAAKVAGDDRLSPGVQIRLPNEDVEGVVTDIDTDEIHIERDNGDVTHIPHRMVVKQRWTTVADSKDG